MAFRLVKSIALRLDSAPEGNRTYRAQTERQATEGIPPEDDLKPARSVF